MKTRHTWSLTLALGLTLCSAETRADVKPLAARVGVDEHPGSTIPVDLEVTDEQAHAHPLQDYLHAGKPLLLSIAYYHCPGLCDVSLRALATTLRKLSWKLGDEYIGLTVSLDPHDTPATAAAKRSNVLTLLHTDDPAWTFAVARAPVVHRLTDALGYHYDFDAATHQYAHPAVSVVLTPSGKISRYLYGPTLDAGSVQLALREARLERGGPTALIDRTILACYRYDPATHRYALLILGVMRGGAALIALALALAIYGFIRRGRAQRHAS